MKAQRKGVSSIIVYDHTTMTTPVLVRSRKLSEKNCVRKQDLIATTMYFNMAVKFVLSIICVACLPGVMLDELPDIPNISETVSPNVICFEKCKCRGTIVVCEDIGLKTDDLPILTQKIWNNTEVLYLSNNKLTDFPLKLLGRLTELRELHLRRNQLSHVPNHEDGELRKLKILDLEDNYITTLSEIQFKGYGGLHTLYLSQNNITSLKSDTVFKYLVHLRELLMDDNRIKDISELTFRHLVDLNLLSVTSNVIEELKPAMFDGLHRLRDVLFHNNKLQTIPDYIFSRNKLLTFIDLSGNRISNLPRYAFANLTNIGKLHILLSYNHLRSLPKTAFQNSKELSVSLDGNMFHCDCQLLAAINKLQQKDTNQVISGECMTPLQLEAHSLSAMTHVEVQCNICEVHQCEHNGTCISTTHRERELSTDAFHCDCKDGFDGKLCQIHSPQACTPGNCAKDGNKKKTVSLATWIAIGISVFVLIGAVIVAVLVRRRRKHPNAYLIEDLDEINEI